MKVKDLYNWCKAYPHKEAEVYLVKAWEQCDEQGALTDLYRLRDISEQVVVVDTGLDFDEVREVLLDFEEEVAL